MCQVNPAITAPRESHDGWRYADHPPGRSQGSFYSSGVRQVVLGSDACFIGHRAYENCKLLTLVDISSTAIDTLHVHTFSQCHSLDTVKLPSCLREIRAEVFVGLETVSSSPTLFVLETGWKHGDIHMLPSMPLRDVLS